MGGDRAAHGRALPGARRVLSPPGAPPAPQRGIRIMLPVTRVVLWGSLALLLYTHAGYPALLWLLVRARRGGERSEQGCAWEAHAPSVSLIIAAHDEEEVIAARVADALGLDYPRDRLEVIVASDG